MCRNLSCADAGDCLPSKPVLLPDVNVHQGEQVSGSSFLAVLLSCIRDVYLQVTASWVLSCSN